eukprot:gene5006-6234_t
MATIEEIPTDVPVTEETTTETPAPAQAAKKTSRHEKKYKDAMSKLGMSPVTDIFRVTLKQAKGLLCVVPEPEVYKSNTSDTYVIFGEPKFEDPSAARASKAAANVEAATKVEPTPVEDAPAPVEENTVDDENVDLEGLDPKDVEIVMKETKASKAKAVAALKKTPGDIVSAVMELTM